jgi:hypothetical protein
VVREVEGAPTEQSRNDRTRGKNGGCPDSQSVEVSLLAVKIALRRFKYKAG